MNTMVTRALALVVLAGCLGLSGCGGGSSGGGNNSGQAVNFDSFATSTLNDDESSAPRDLDDLDFEFDDDPGAYDSIVD